MYYLARTPAVTLYFILQPRPKFDRAEYSKRQSPQCYHPSFIMTANANFLGIHGFVVLCVLRFKTCHQECIIACLRIIHLSLRSCHRLSKTPFSVLILLCRFHSEQDFLDSNAHRVTPCHLAKLMDRTIWILERA